MRYSKKRVLIIVFIAWCVFFFASALIPLTPLRYTMAEDIILYLIMPGVLVEFILEFLSGGAIGLLSGSVTSVIIKLLLVYISSPGFYLVITYLIMRRMERHPLNSKTNNGNITTLSGSDDKYF